MTKGMGWLKGVLSNQNDVDQMNEEKALAELIEEQDIELEEPEQTEQPSSARIFSKENQDKITLDLIVSLENMLNDRQLNLFKIKDLEGQLQTANETISRLKHEQVKKEQLLHDKNKEIRVLESDLTNKQMRYDQLLEDYKDYQSSSNNEFEKISNQLEKEIHKYRKLNEESTNAQYQSMLKIKELEERIRELEVENQEYLRLYEKTIAEKNELLQTINDFTERMSFSFSPKAQSFNSLPEE